MARGLQEEEEKEEGAGFGAGPKSSWALCLVVVGRTGGAGLLEVLGSINRG